MTERTGNKLLTAALALFLPLAALTACAPKSAKTIDPMNPEAPFVSEEPSRNDAYYHFALSRMLYLDGRNADSLRELEYAEIADPKSAYLKYNLALMYISEGRMTDALTKLEESIEVGPDFAPSYTLLGRVYASSQDPALKEKSDSILNKAVELDPTDAESLLFLAIMDTEAGNLDAAEAKFEKITQLYPDSEKG